MLINDIDFKKPPPWSTNLPEHLWYLEDEDNYDDFKWPVTVMPDGRTELDHACDIIFSKLGIKR